MDRAFNRLLPPASSVVEGDAREKMNESNDRDKAKQQKHLLLCLQKRNKSQRWLIATGN